MGRRSRHSAKTGDGAIYQSRAASGASSPSRRDDSDDDPMYNEVERFHRRKEEEDYLALGDDGDAGDESSEDDGLTKHREGVFDLGVAGSSAEEEDDDDESDEEDEGAAERATQRRAAVIAEGFNSSSDDDSESEEDGGKRSKLLNWGDQKQSYYHGDTADLEIGQDVEDAYLEEAAGREVEKARLEAMDEADFMLDGDDDGDRDGGAPEGRAAPTSKKRRKAEGDAMETLQAARRSKPLSQLSKKDKAKRLQAHHPELLPLVRHFAGPLRDLNDTTMVAAGALLKDGVAKGAREAEAVGATPAGLRYLITKCMLQASQALNVSLYLLLKADQASGSTTQGDASLVEEDDGDDIRHHPVMECLNQMTELSDRLREGVEDKTPGLQEQVRSLVKAVALMDGGDLSSSEGSDSDDDDDGNGTDSSEVQGDVEHAAEASAAPPASDDDDASSSESDDEEHETQAAVQRRIMTEAKFALRNQDIDRDDVKSSKSRKRRLEPPTTSDYGDEAAEVSDKALAASRKLASAMNSIAQKSTVSQNRSKTSAAAEEDGDGDYDQMQRGLSMMEEELGKGSDDGDGVSGNDDDEEGLGDSDEDEFYRTIQQKSKAKKEAKERMYAVAPKYPRLEGLVEGERAIGNTILKNRGLVPHKAKINRNPRVKKREQYRKALISRKGAVREVRTDEGHKYGGESTGIKSGISRSRKLSGK